MTRLSSLRSLFLLLALAVSGCKPVASQKSARAALPPQPTLGESGNPFAVYMYGTADVGAPILVASCVKLSLEAKDAPLGRAIEASLRADNQCEVPVAVLTAPLEIRVLRKGARPPAETMNHAVYAIAYVLPRDAGDEHLTFLGDGGLKVHKLPTYFLVDPRSTSSIPFVGTSQELKQLAAGSYLLSLITVVVPSVDASDMKAPFDLGRTVRRHDANGPATGTADRTLVIPPTAERLGGAASFKVQ